MDIKVSNDSNVSSDLLIRVAPNDNKAVYKCLVSNEASTVPRTKNVTIDPVYFMSDKLSTSSDTISVWNDSVKAPKDYTEVTCSTGECNPSCNISWTYNGQIISNSIHNVVNEVSMVEVINHSTINNLHKNNNKSSGAIFKIETKTSVGPFRGAITDSKLFVSNRKKTWSNIDESSNFTCVSSYFKEEVVKVLTISVLSVELDTSFNDISLISSNFYTSMSEFNLMAMVRSSPSVVITLGFVLLLLIVVIVFSSIVLIKKTISGRESSRNSTTTTGSGSNSSSNSPSSSNQSVRREGTGSTEGVSIKVNGNGLGANGNVTNAAIGMNGSAKGASGSVVGSSVKAADGKNEEPSPSLPSSSLLSTTTSIHCHHSPAGSSIASSQINYNQGQVANYGNGYDSINSRCPVRMNGNPYLTPSSNYPTLDQRYQTMPCDGQQTKIVDPYQETLNISGGSLREKTDKIRKRVKLLIDGHLIPDMDHQSSSAGANGHYSGSNHCAVLPSIMDHAPSTAQQINGFEHCGQYSYQNTPDHNYVHCDSPQLSDHVHGHLHVSIHPDVVNNGHYDRNAFKYTVTNGHLYPTDEHLWKELFKNIFRIFKNFTNISDKSDNSWFGRWWLMENIHRILFVEFLRTLTFAIWSSDQEKWKKGDGKKNKRCEEEIIFQIRG